MRRRGWGRWHAVRDESGTWPTGLAALASGKAAPARLDEVLKADGNFEGQGIEFRQVGVVGMARADAAFTGKEAAASSWAGALTGPGYSIQELRRLLDLHLANDSIIRTERAARTGDRGLTHKQLAEALQRGAGWDRILRHGARLAISLGEIDHAVSLYAAFLHVNDAWAQRELDDALYAPLWPALQRWRPCMAKPPCAKP